MIYRSTYLNCEYLVYKIAVNFSFTKHGNRNNGIPKYVFSLFTGREGK